MELSIVLVHYHTPELLAPCLEALAAAVAEAGLADQAEAVIVDNGGAPAELAPVAGLATRIIDAGGNRGFAGGVNLGIAATCGANVVVMNPDVEVEVGALQALLAALGAGFDVVGPQLVWDREARLLLPPTEVRSRSAELRRRLALGDARAAAAARLQWRRHARRHWTACEPTPSFELSGAMLLARRDAFERFGTFDEGFFLYFEETEWLRRVRRAGGRAALVPQAQARHAFARSSVREPNAAGWFAQSAQRFGEMAWGDRFLHAIAERAEHRRNAIPEPVWSEVLRLSGEAGWVEVSPSPCGFPAAGERLGPGVPRSWAPPPDVAESWAAGTVLFLREVDDLGRERGWAKVAL
jgi:GT2 family glycosyltransferase